MPKNEKIVKKALSDQEATILSNIQSSIQELLSMNEAAPEAAPAEEVQLAEGEKPDGEKTDEEKKKEEEREVTVSIKKDVVTTPSDGPTASDDAEERVNEPQTDESQRNADAIGKALIQALGGTVKKVEEPVNPVMKSLEGLTAVIKQIADSGNQNSAAIKQICDGIGVTGEMEKAEKALKDKEVQQPNQTAEIVREIYKGMMEMNGKISQNTPVEKSNSTIVNENVGSYDIMKALTAHKDHPAYNAKGVN